MAEFLRKGMGWRPQLPDIRDHIYTAKRGMFKDVDLRPNCPPIWDQGQTSGCTAFAIASAVAYMRTVEKLPSFTPSRLFIYACERIVENDLGKDDGAEIRTGIKCVASQGVPDEIYWPFDVSKLLVRPDEIAYKFALTDLVGEYLNVPITENSVLTALTNNLPIVFGVTLYDSFDGEEVSTTGQVPLPAKTENVIGGHAMVIVGAKIKERKFIVRNSWRTDWGDKGFCYFPFDYLLDENLADDFWVILSIKK